MVNSQAKEREAWDSTCISTEYLSTVLIHVIKYLNVQASNTSLKLIAKFEVEYSLLCCHFNYSRKLCAIKGFIVFDNIHVCISPVWTFIFSKREIKYFLFKVYIMAVKVNWSYSYLFFLYKLTSLSIILQARIFDADLLNPMYQSRWKFCFILLILLESFLCCLLVYTPFVPL